jgi:hypothetical protein
MNTFPPSMCLASSSPIMFYSEWEYYVGHCDVSDDTYTTLWKPGPITSSVVSSQTSSYSGWPVGNSCILASSAINFLWHVLLTILWHADPLLGNDGEASK